MDDFLLGLLFMLLGSGLHLLAAWQGGEPRRIGTAAAELRLGVRAARRRRHP